MAMTPLPPAADVKSFISRQPAWKPGAQLPWDALFRNLGNLGGPRPSFMSPAAYGGHVYAQAPLAAARALEQEDSRGTESDEGKLGIHTIQGVFTAPGLQDRPFIYQVSPISAGRSFAACLVNARQPKQASQNPAGPFPASDAHLDLDAICFSCITTFKRSRSTPVEVEAPQSAQERYAHILLSRAPGQWDVSPQIDLDVVKQFFPREGAGAFPILAMHKVDMDEYNAEKPAAERRELICYRLLEPLPSDDVNAHIVCHAFEADRNGLLMIANHVGYGHNLGKAASLTYSFYVHVNPEEAVMDGDGWWLQEIGWPRARPKHGRHLQLDPLLHPSQTGVCSQTPASPLSNTPGAQDQMQSELEMLEVLRTLQTPFDAVYELSPDGAHYVKPASLRDTPVAKITQDSPYWIPSWESLDDYLAKEGGEDAKKQEWRIRLQRNPGDKKAREAVKKHQDNMSKHYKIREIFGPDSDYHPNQVVSKRHLPTRGLCRKEVMYRLACKISELRELHARGVLAMEPWDFIRWRIGKKIQEKLSLPGKSASSFMASAVYRLCDENQDGSNPHGDAVLRAAVMLAARSQKRLGNYKTHQPPFATRIRMAPIHTEMQS
ncbi:acyl-CoA thioesterase II [Ophiocordyceps sinensis CO18]|uniref:Acyl-CoA thioesterase II n=1 Tax=Ophiocordyceps sinensis (strain Co18 / CGMCC 3.14243) TaxID=911162 RepID=T5AFN6_OPHSC|nr:acyl-CoA thioesterase II [Ophiocordyceps sinensis CO18]